MRRKGSLVPISIILLLLSMLLSLRLGSVHMDTKSLIAAAFSGTNTLDGTIFYYSRLPRTIAAALSGFALSISGAILQSVLANRLAAPGIIGVNSGAGLAVTICCALGVISGWSIAISSFLGALISAVCVMLISQRIKASRSTVLLAGVSLNYILSAFSDIIATVAPKVTYLSSDFRIGGFSSLSYLRLYPAAAIILLSSLIVFSMTNELEVLSLGDDSARALGMNTTYIRALFLILSSLLAGAAVSFSGLLGFVGLVVPNFTRRILDGKNKLLLPLSGIFGAILVTLCDTFSRVVFRPYEIPVGIILAIIGGPVFLYMVLKRGNYAKKS